MTTRELQRLRSALQRVERAMRAVPDPDPADQVGGALYPFISRLASDADGALVILDAALGVEKGASL